MLLSKTSGEMDSILARTVSYMYIDVCYYAFSKDLRLCVLPRVNSHQKRHTLGCLFYAYKKKCNNIKLMHFSNLISYILPLNKFAANNRNNFDRYFDVNFWDSFYPITSFDYKGENRTTRLI